LRGISLASDAGEDLQNLVIALPIFKEKYYEGMPVTRAEAVTRLGISEIAGKRLFELFHISMLTHGGSGSGDGWHEFGVSPLIRKFRNVSTVDEFFTVYNDLVKQQQEAYSTTNLAEEDANGPEDIFRLNANLPSDLLLDSSLRQILESDWEEMQICLGNNAWKAVGLLAGSCCEAILVDLLQRDPSVIPEKRQDQWRSKLGLREFAQFAKEARLISPESHMLITVMKRWRDLVHPWRAATHRLPTETSARAMLMFLELLIEDLRISATS
jgi:hypothetical protein